MVLSVGGRPFWTFTPVFFIVGLMVWACSTYVIEVRPHRTSLTLVMFFFFMNMWSLFMAVFTPPGHVPSHWSCVYGSDPSRQAFELKNTGELRTCRRCNVYKPDRSHHCSSCDRCVLKMDHHCPWINNCVGFFNQKFFLLFILYITMCCTFVGLTAWEALWHSFDFLAEKQPRQLFKAIRAINFAFSYIVVVVFSVSLGMFVSFHFGLVMKNTTTIERLEKMDRLRGMHQHHMYDVGWRENFIAVFGEKWYLWLLPIATTPGDGTLFPVSRPTTSGYGAH
eukprot:PhM_4_TR1063/c0_g1_i1/m.83410/K20028/ZDHHC2_15_20; palmitoyltransferase ZDHHC2/15/20